MAANFVCLDQRSVKIMGRMPGHATMGQKTCVTAIRTYQLEKTAEAVNPVPTERSATMNISD